MDFLYDATPISSFAPNTFFDLPYTTLTMARGSTRTIAKNHRQKGASAAQNSVYQTYELLELIMLDLRPKDIIRAAMRVNKTWHTTINSSVPLNKEIVSSSFVLQHLEKDSDHASAASITHVAIFWAPCSPNKLARRRSFMLLINRSTRHTQRNSLMAMKGYLA